MQSLSNSLPMHWPTKPHAPELSALGCSLQNGHSVLSCCWSHAQWTHTLVSQGLLLWHNLIHIPGCQFFQMSLPRCSLGYPPIDGCWHVEAGQHWRGSRLPCHLWPPGKKGATQLFTGQIGIAQALLHSSGRPSQHISAFKGWPCKCSLCSERWLRLNFNAQLLLVILQYFASWPEHYKRVFRYLVETLV